MSDYGRVIKNYTHVLNDYKRVFLTFTKILLKKRYD